MIELTENLLYKLEEKMMQLLADAEGLRQQVQRLQVENNAYKLEKDNNARKLQDLVNLLDSVSSVEYSAPIAATSYATPVLVQQA